MYIKITDKQLETGDLDFLSAMQLLTSAILQLMHRTIDFASNEEEAQALKESVYDTANRAFTAVLDSFDPDQTNNDDLDINLVIALQDEVVQEALATIKEYNPKRYRRIVREQRLGSLKS